MEVSFRDADLSTGTRAISVVVRKEHADVTLDEIDRFALRLGVRTWPQRTTVAWARDTSIIPAATNQTGAQTAPAYGEISLLVTSGDTSRWHAVPLASASDYRLEDESATFLFEDGSRGVRFASDHAPVVASLKACSNGGDTIRVDLRVSEFVSKAPNAISLQYGESATSCAVAQESPQVIGFDCAGSDAGALLIATVSGYVVAQSTGRTMPLLAVRSDAMQLATTSDGCFVYRPLIVD